MLKKFVAALAALLAATAFAAVDANKATQAELEAISGIGPSISAAIIAERKKGEFKDWNDLFNRIRGVGDRSAAKFSQGGLTVAGKPYPGPPYVEPTKTSTAAKSASGAKPATGATRGGEAPKATPARSASAAKGGTKSAKEEKGDAKTAKTAAKAEAKSTAASAPKK